MTAALALEQVSLTLGRRSVLEGLSLLIEPGTVMALLGPSGSGKTSVLRLLLGLIVPSSGRVRLGGEVVTDGPRLLRPPEERRLAVVFQDLALWPHLTVQGNLSFGLEAQGIERKVREARIHEMLERVGLNGYARRYPGELSGGERQRIAIARAMVLQPHAVLLDEPLSTLDVVLKQELLTCFLQLFREHRTTALYVTHDPREAVAMGDAIAVLEKGRLSQQGSAQMLRERPATPFVAQLMRTLEAAQ